jgi:hypothetical protein
VTQRKIGLEIKKEEEECSSEEGVEGPKYEETTTTRLFGGFG